MIGEYGETLVVDWGLAKASGERVVDAFDHSLLKPSSGSGSAPTLYGSAVGTPAYMSPEQAAGKLDELCPASDVYSIGVSLQCLLTGIRPKPIGKSGTVANQHKLTMNAKCPKPLWSICCKATMMRIKDRYTSTSDLASELRDWLAGQKVHAHRETISEMVGRLVGKFPTEVASAVFILLSLLVFATLAVWQISIARSSADVARTLAESREKLSEERRLEVQEQVQVANQALYTVATQRALEALSRGDSPSMKNSFDEIKNSAFARSRGWEHFYLKRFRIEAPRTYTFPTIANYRDNNVVLVKAGRWMACPAGGDGGGMLFELVDVLDPSKRLLLPKLNLERLETPVTTEVSADGGIIAVAEFGGPLFALSVDENRWNRIGLENYSEFGICSDSESFVVSSMASVFGAGKVSRLGLKSDEIASSVVEGPASIACNELGYAFAFRKNPRSGSSTVLSNLGVDITINLESSQQIVNAPKTSVFPKLYLSENSRWVGLVPSSSVALLNLIGTRASDGLWLWDCSEGREISIRGDTANTTCCDVSRDGKTLATGCEDGTIRFWSLPGGQLIGSVLSSKVPIVDVQWHSTDKIVATDTLGVLGPFDPTNYFFTRSFGPRLNFHDELVCLSGSADDRYVAAGVGYVNRQNGESKGTIWVCDVIGDSIEFQTETTSGGDLFLQLHPSGTLLAVGSDRAVEVFDLETKKRMQVHEKRSLLSWGQEKEEIVLGGRSLVEVRKGGFESKRFSGESYSWIERGSLSANGRMLAFIDDEFRFGTVDLAVATSLPPSDDSTDSVRFRTTEPRVSISGDSKLVAVTTADNCIRVIHTDSKEELHRIKLVDIVADLKFNVDSTRLLIATTRNRRGSILSYEVKNWTQVVALSVDDTCRAVMESNDGRSIFSSSRDGVFKQWSGID